MIQALELAEKGRGTVTPNPMVGAVLVKDGQIIGSGYHSQAGMPHAERIAIESSTVSPKNATLYVTLEPCCHQGLTPPCTDLILEKGIKRVVSGSRDPNPMVGGRGFEILRSNGLEVTENVCEEECMKLNEVFFYYIKNNRPFVVMKYAMTADGKIATSSGASKWITGREARNHVHETRHALTAIMVGIGTVIADDPLLTCRIHGGRNPIRIICDTRLRTPLKSRIVATAQKVLTFIATSCREENRRQPYLQAGCHILSVPQKNGHVDLEALMTLLGKKKIDSLLLEGGSRLNWSALKAGIVQKVQCYMAPKIFGGKTAPTPVGGAGVNLPHEAFQLNHTQVKELDKDLLLESEVIYPCLQES